MATPVALPPPIPSAAAFAIGQSPFSAADTLALQAAFAAATQPVVAQPNSPVHGNGGPPAKRRRPSAEPTGAGTQSLQQQFAGKQRPPRPPAMLDSGSLVLDLSGTAREGSGSPPGTGRSPRGCAASPGATPGARRPAKKSSKTLGRVCIECCTSVTSQWRSQGLLCNSCGVKLVKGRLPMDAESMHRRWQRLPRAIRNHPMWEAAQVVAAAQSAAAAAAAAGKPWACAACGEQGEEKVAGSCGLHYCPDCVGRRQLGMAPLNGAAAVAAAVTYPRISPPEQPVPVSAPVPAAAGHNRRKQATPRSAATGSLSPVSPSSSGSSSIQAYGWQGGREEGQDDASSKERSPGNRPGARRPHSSRTKQQAAEQTQSLGLFVSPGGRSNLAAAPATPASGKTSGSAALARQQRPSETPTAAEAAAALLVLTESDELRVAAAFQMGPNPDSLSIGNTVGSMAVAGTASQDQPGVPRSAVVPLEGALQLMAGANNGGWPAASMAAAAAACRTPPAQGNASVDTMQLYSQLIAAACTPQAAAAGLSQALVGKYLAAHTQPTQALAGAASAASPEVAAAIRGQQEQQARLVSLMAAEGQFTAVVALMKSVVQLAGLGK